MKNIQNKIITIFKENLFFNLKMQKKAKDIPIENFEDYANVKKSPAIMNQLDSKNEETVIFSCLVNKKFKGFLFN